MTRFATLAALAASLALVPSCAVPRTAIVTGAVTAVAGAAIIHESQHQPESVAFLDPAGLASLTGSVLGGTILTVGAGLIIAGLVGLDQEHKATREAPLPALSQGPVAPATAQVSFAPPGSASAVLAARTDQLTTQLQLEARAGHCEAATAIARRLAVLDRERTVALIEGDATVSSCVGYRI